MTSELRAAQSHLRNDPIMAQLIATHELTTLPQSHEINLFSELITSIISQQLSVKVASVIEQRVINLLPDKEITPQNLTAIDAESLRACGVSYAKIKYMQSASAAALTGLVDFAALDQKSDEDVVAELVQIHGVGKWTAEMLLIFSLGRPDVFSIGDLGLRTAVSRLYGVERTDLSAIEAIASQWSPYRSTASRYLWKSLDNSPK